MESDQRDSADAYFAPQVPLGPWPKDRKLKALGVYMRQQMVDCVEPLTLALLTRVLDWSHDETQVLIAHVKNEFRNPQNHFYKIFYFVHGRKPAGISCVSERH